MGQVKTPMMAYRTIFSIQAIMYTTTMSKIGRGIGPSKPRNWMELGQNITSQSSPVGEKTQCSRINAGDRSPAAANSDIHLPNRDLIDTLCMILPVRPDCCAQTSYSASFLLLKMRSQHPSSLKMP
jgi:hypothetical protein